MEISKKSSRLICSILVLCTLAGTVVSCGNTTEVPSQSITVTTSAAEEHAATLQKKLPDLDVPVVLGTAAEGSAYGIDMTSFEDDGYVIKSTDEAVLLFGKTTYGLTTATNRFVNMYKANAVENVVYHEGYRIDRLEIFGVDISDYVIEYPENGTADMKFAVTELIRLVKQATGVALTSHAGDSGADHVIEFRNSDDPELRFDGYRYFEENGVLVFEGSSVRQGCTTAVYRFLQNECGWDELIEGEAYLNEADYINIPTEINKTEVPAFDHLYTHNSNWNPFHKDQNSYVSTGVISHACHGIQTNNFFMMDSPLDMPCFTDEELYEVCAYNVEKYIQARYSNPNFKAVDIATPDSNSFCFCENCFDLFMEEGSHSAAIVLFANRLAEDMNELYPGLVYQIFAYNDTNKPPKTVRPNEMVHVTFCFDIICGNHPLDGSECGDEPNFVGRKNSEFAEWFEGWCDITNNIYVWFYCLDTNFHDHTVIQTIYKDFTYLHENGVTGIMYQCTAYGLGMKRIFKQLAHALNWDIDMTEEEYYALYEHLLEKEYGPGWELISEYEKIMLESQNRIGCFVTWGWSRPIHMNNKLYDTFYYATVYDYIVELFDRAIAMAETPDQVKRCELLYASALYKGCYSEYFVAYEKDNTERITVLSERFLRAMEIMKKYGFKMDSETGKYYTVDGTLCQFRCASLEDAAWIDWYVKWDELCPNHTKPEPEKYVGIERPPVTYF